MDLWRLLMTAPPAQAGSARAGYSGLCPVGFQVLPRTETGDLKEIGDPKMKGSMLSLMDG